jgi:hypothetical protein
VAEVPLDWLARAQRERRRRQEAAQRAAGVTVGLFRLPERDPKPVPPPGFFEAGENVVLDPIVAVKVKAAAELREIIRARRYGRPANLGGGG